MNRLRTILRQMEKSAVVSVFFQNETTVRKFRKSLLEFEIIGISLAQDKLRNLGVGQRKINFVQHV